MESKVPAGNDIQAHNEPLCLKLPDRWQAMSQHVLSERILVLIQPSEGFIKLPAGECNLTDHYHYLKKKGGKKTQRLPSQTGINLKSEQIWIF